MENYMFNIKSLGAGGFGEVYKGTRCIDGKDVVVKKAKDAMNEVVILQKLKNVIGVIMLIDFFIHRDYFYIVFNYNPKLVDLDKYLSTYLISEQKAQRLLIQLVNIIKRCIAAGIHHNDLKPQNVLTDGVTVILIDFGLATSTIEKDIGPGTLIYSPPEFVELSNYEPNCGTVWAMGLILYCMIHAGQLPFKNYRDIIDDRPVTILNKILSKNCKNFLRLCLIKDPVKRLTLQDMYCHPFICGS